MNFGVLEALLLSVPTLTIVGAASVLPAVYLRRKREKTQPAVNAEKSRNIRASAEIVDSVPTNNTYPQLEKAFADLQEKLAAQQMDLHINLEGYTKDGNQQGI